MKITEYKKDKNIKRQLISIDLIKPDKNQPRKEFEEDVLNKMKVLIEKSGVINDIEVDENFVIITGEQRWRAAKLAGLKEVPIQVLGNMSSEARFVRQLRENMGRGSMVPLDIANSLDKIRGWMSNLTGSVDRDKKHVSEYFQKSIKELHELLAIEEDTIREYLSLLGEDEEVKEALKVKGFSRTKVREMKRVPEKYKKGLQGVVVKQKKIARDTVVHLAEAIRRADKYNEPEKVRELLKENYEGLSMVQALNKINKIVPDEEERLKEPSDAMKAIAEKVIELMELLDSHPLSSFDNFHRPYVISDINSLGAYLGNYLKEKIIKSKETKLLN